MTDNAKPKKKLVTSIEIETLLQTKWSKISSYERDELLFRRLGDLDKAEFEKLNILLREYDIIEDANKNILVKRLLSKSFCETSVENRNTGDKKENEPVEEPEVVVYLLELFCSTSNRDALVGCLLEQYAEAAKLYGPRRAKLLLWIRAARSIFDVLRGSIKKLALVAALVQAVQWFRKLSS